MKKNKTTYQYIIKKCKVEQKKSLPGQSQNFSPNPGTCYSDKEDFHIEVYVLLIMFFSGHAEEERKWEINEIVDHL